MHCSKCGQAVDPPADGENDSDCSAQSREERRLEIIELARDQRQQEGAVEIDDNALLSEGNENGCYVQVR